MSHLCPNHGEIRDLKIKPYVACYDEEADIWEVFEGPECSTYLGCADTIDEAEKVAKWIEEDRKCW